LAPWVPVSLALCVVVILLMETGSKKIIENYVSELPDGLKGRLASNSERVHLESSVGVVSDEHWWFLQKIGNCPIGCEWIDGIDEVYQSNEKFERESKYWTMNNVVIVGWDCSGNPFGQDKKTGKILIEYHDGPTGVSEAAPNLIAFLINLLK